MIKVNISKNQIVITGHALYDDYGKDIVCASVSMLVISTINGILRLDDKAIKYKQTKDTLTIDILKNTKTAEVLILNMISLLKELNQKYPKNIKLKEV